MANDDFFTATKEWQPVQANGANITDGIFSVFNPNSGTVQFQKTNVEPPAIQISGPSCLNEQVRSLKYSLVSPEELFCRTSKEPVVIGVIPS